MGVVVRLAQQSDLAAIAALASSQQYIDERHIAYLGLDAASIAEDIDGVGEWAASSERRCRCDVQAGPLRAPRHHHRKKKRVATSTTSTTSPSIPDIERNGLGGEVVRHASADLFARGVDYVHLSVREGNIDERPLSGVTARRSAAHGRHR